MMQLFDTTLSLQCRQTCQIMESCCIDKLQARVENLSAKEKEQKNGNED